MSHIDGVNMVYLVGITYDDFQEVGFALVRIYDNLESAQTLADSILEEYKIKVENKKQKYQEIKYVPCSEELTAENHWNVIAILQRDVES